MSEETAATEIPLPEPPVESMVNALIARVGEEGVYTLIAECLRAVPRIRAVDLVNTHLPTVKLGLSADRGRMARLLSDGVSRRRPAVLEALQAIARDPFELKAPEEAKDGLDAAIEELNRARSDTSNVERKQQAAREVGSLVKEALEPDEAHRLILLNAFPDVVDDMLSVLES
ncbi:MAG: hypothetical protein ACE5IK_14250 [Acidobacteriota bacterium]